MFFVALGFWLHSCSSLIPVIVQVRVLKRWDVLKWWFLFRNSVNFLRSYSSITIGALSQGESFTTLMNGTMHGLKIYNKSLEEKEIVEGFLALDWKDLLRESLACRCLDCQNIWITNKKWCAKKPGKIFLFNSRLSHLFIDWWCLTRTRFLFTFWVPKNVNHAFRNA